MDNYYNKKNIIKRMKRLVASNLGFQQEAIDPSILLLLEAFGEEIYKLSGEVENIEARIIEKLATMLTLGKTVAPLPDHAILHVSSQEKEKSLTKETGFATRKQGEHIAYSFYPVCNTVIHQGDIRLLADEECVFLIERDREKSLHIRSRKVQTAKKNKIWIGLELSDSITSLNNVSFFFDFHTLIDKKDYLNLLPYTIWRLGDHVLRMSSGIYDIPSVYENDSVRIFSEYDVCTMIDRSIREKYNIHYLTVKDEILIEEYRTSFPEALKKEYPEEKLAEFDQALVWLEIEFPTTIKKEILDTMQVNMNTVPVANKILRSQIVNVKNIMQIIPLEIGHNEYFISIHSITDSQGNSYYELPFNGSNCTYSLRRGGCERSDIRDVRDYMLNLSDILDTHAASISINSDSEDDFTKIAKKTSVMAKQLQQAIDTMKDQREIPVYVIPEQLKEEEVLFLKYWLTHCNATRYLKAGSNLFAVTDAATGFSPAILLTTPSGGEKPPHARDRKNLYQQVLSSNSIIINKNDIISFCETEFCDSIASAEVRRGIATSKNIKENLLQTIDVYLTPHKKLQLIFQRQDMSEYFLQKLTEHSPQNFNYRVFIRNHE